MPERPPRPFAPALIPLIGLVLALAGPGLASAQAADRIDSPGQGSTVSGRVEVRGTAGSAGPRFRSYRLEFGPGPAPGEWRPIGPERDHSVENGVLGLWETADLPPGTYTLRLRVFDEDGHEQESRVTVTVAAPAAAATPTATQAPTPTPTPTPEPAAEPPPQPPAPTPQPPGGGPFRCPMLYYHEVPGQAGLAAQLATFLQAGYRPVTLGRMVDGLEGRAEPPPGCLVLTFDDALASQMSGALPILLRFGVPATFFVMPGFRDGVHRYMSSDDFRALRDAGMEIGSHTLHHASLPYLLRANYGAFQSEVILSKQFLEDELGQTVDLLAYPNGSWDYPTADEVRKAGYRAAASTMPGSWQRPEDRYWLRRIRADAWEPPGVVLARLRG